MREWINLGIGILLIFGGLGAYFEYSCANELIRAICLGLFIIGFVPLVFGIAEIRKNWKNE